ncbi:acyl-CoA thioesterase [Nesterenkonia ebinurensis]|uniref:acyl-CoA thioesterase n=1 Tax=Nesterenkonia ebinurensis TaxID=2608252 RepID=UPI00123D403B|nr:acyl-CoA thioesterase domain-containing protein [Nesterenkonia ebinurensis]
MSTEDQIPANSPDSDRMLAALELTPAAAVDNDAAVSAYTARTQYVPWPKAYGGDLVAQGVRAMQASFAPSSGKALHSAHSYFMRPGDVGAEIRYEVEHLRDGRGYSTRQVRAYQGGKIIYTGLGSFSVSAEGPEYAPALEDAVGGELPAPEDVPSTAEALQSAGVLGTSGAQPDGIPESLRKAADYWAYGRSFDIRHVPGPVYLQTDETHTPRQAIWLKTFALLPSGDPQLHQAALAYVCDYTILEPSLRAVGMHWTAEGFVSASLDHSMWFHRPARVDEWLLYLSESRNVSNQRGLSNGAFYTRDGTLVASLAQEGMIRMPS